GRADYRIRARLDRLSAEEVEAAGDELPSGGPPFTLDGALALTYRHGGREPIEDLHFHLYLNAFANDRSTHLVESGGRLRGRESAEGWGFTELVAVRLVDGERRTDLLPSLRYLQPDGGSPDDRSVFAVRLPEPLAAGGTLTVEVEWRSRLPRVRRRTGYKDDFLLVAQWFPKLGVWEDGQGWNCHEFHARTEFYADYGHYDVTLDLPGEYRDKVFASGQQHNAVPSGGRVEVTFLAPSYKDRERTDARGRTPLVHDFAWTADPDFVVERGAFVFDEWAERFPEEVQAAEAAFGPDVDLRLRDVAVTALVQPEHRTQAARHVEATCAALFFYGLWFGEYPYEHVVVVDPAWGGGGAGGMEYPTLFTAGTRMFAEPWMHTPESVTVHEAGHQFWYGLVGNNEFEAAWLDEGFNSFTDSEVLARWLGPRAASTDYSGLPMRGVRLARTGAGTLG
ncbi:MAG TPA: hypothetical protein VJP77_01425, partial [Planctomycetota bacterium]|nr:hypothetical protein [Planctomycetota bacterium]